jgi:CheY-like chemotaxis protein
VKEAASRSADITRQLLAFARKQSVAPEVLDLNDRVSGMLKMLPRLLGEDVILTSAPQPGLWPIRIDPSQVDQILTNLCVNARKAIADVGTIAIETANVVIDDAFCAEHLTGVPGEYVRLIVRDTGSGMDAATLSHIFEPFFTTGETGEGVGLGLATVFGAVTQNDGFIDVSSELGSGTTFAIYLPRHVSPRAPAFDARPTAVASSGHETILLVEDEPALLRITTKMLQSRGYTVLQASGPEEALRVAGQHSNQIDLLLTDVIMPGMNGRDLTAAMHTLHPHVRQLFMSGYPSDVIATHGVLEEGVHFIQKPFQIAQLATKVREALGRA